MIEEFQWQHNGNRLKLVMNFPPYLKFKTIVNDEGTFLSKLTFIVPSLDNTIELRFILFMILFTKTIVFLLTKLIWLKKVWTSKIPNSKRYKDKKNSFIILNEENV
jgi:hypothetical protein